MLTHAPECTCRACKPDAKYIPLVTEQYRIDLYNLTFTAKEVFLRNGMWFVRYTRSGDDLNFIIPVTRWNTEARRYA